MRYDAIGNVHKAAIRGCLEHVSKWVYVSQWVEGILSFMLRRFESSLKHPPRE